MAPLKVLLCNERLIFRFGVDRILLMLAKALLAEGHDVQLLCFRCDDAVKKMFEGRVHLFDPSYGADFFGLERSASDALGKLIDARKATSPIDVVVSGGWPFFNAALVGEARGVPTVFIDAGAVPHDGYPQEMLPVQQAVRRARSAALPHFTRVLPISSFICETQTLVDRGSHDGVRVVRLGVDHFDASIFSPDEATAQDEKSLIERLRGHAADGAGLILNLGRFEKQGYKNSHSALEIHRHVLKHKPTARLLILDDGSGVTLPWDQAKTVDCIGSVSDAALCELMSIADAGISVSLWEGFNLPLGEMQRAGRPVLAYNAGAHPEVVCHPWCLSSSQEEIGEKLLKILDVGLPQAVGKSLTAWSSKEEFTWAAAARSYIAELKEVVGATAPRSSESRRPLLIADVSNCSRDPANTGVTRVTRRLLAGLQEHCAVDIVFVWWDVDRRDYRLLDRTRQAFLSAYGGPRDRLSDVNADGPDGQTPGLLLDWMPALHRHDATMLIAEIPMDGHAQHRIAWAKQRGLKTAAVLYDLIPVNHPEFCDPKISADFPDYLVGLTGVDTLVSISQTTMDDYMVHLKQNDLKAPQQCSVIWLPGQFGNHDRQKARTVRREAAEMIDMATPVAVDGKSVVNTVRGKMGLDRRREPIEILCLSTIEPRKNHRRLLKAFSNLRERRPELDLKLTLIGNRYGGAPELAEFVEDCCAADPAITWKGFLSDEEIVEAFGRARFIAYPSLVEGFGLPILESIWMGRPCLCHDKGVMSELAAGGGCLTVDMTDVDALSAALERLATDDELLEQLSKAVSSRHIDTWRDYADSFAATLNYGVSSIEAADGIAKARASREALKSDAVIVRRRVQGFASLLPETFKSTVAASAGGGGSRMPPMTARLVLLTYLKQRRQKADVVGRTIGMLALARRHMHGLRDRLGPPTR